MGGSNELNTFAPTFSLLFTRFCQFYLTILYTFKISLTFFISKSSIFFSEYFLYPSVLPKVSNIYSHVSESNNNIILSLYFLSSLLFPALTQFPESFFFFPVVSVSFWWLVLYHSRVLNLLWTLYPFSRLKPVELNPVFKSVEIGSIKILSSKYFLNCYAVICVLLLTLRSRNDAIILK